MPKFYVSLVRGLVGYYVLFEAPDWATVRQHVAAYYGRMWCSVYSESEFNKHIVGTYPAKVINEDKPIVLHEWQWE